MRKHFPFAALLAISFLTQHEAIADNSLADWEGYWGNVRKNTQRPGHLAVEEAIIGECSQEKRECNVRLRLEQGTGGVFSLGPVLRFTSEPGAPEVAEVSNEKCLVTIRRATGAEGVPELRLTVGPGTGCDPFKSSGMDVAGKTFVLPLFAVSFVSPGLYDDCGQQTGKLRDAWCLDRKVDAIRKKAEKLKQATESSVYGKIKNRWSHHYKYPSDPRTVCADKPDPSKCLLQFFEDEVTQIKEANEARWQAVEKGLEDFYKPGDAAKAKEAVAEVEGVYKRQFQNGLMTGETYKSENILEVVAIEGNGIYVRAALDFANGHSCSFHGAFRYNAAGDFVAVYQSSGSSGNQECKIKLRWDAKLMRLISEDCENARWCGARGSLADEFKMTARKPIRYMKLLKNSREFKEALEGWNKVKDDPFPIKRP